MKKIINRGTAPNDGTGDDLRDALGKVNDNFTDLYNKQTYVSILSSPNSAIDLDCSNNTVFYVLGASSNLSVNFTELSIANTEMRDITFIINQGNTEITIDTVKIANTAQTVFYENGNTHTYTPNNIDIETFSILNSSNTYIITSKLNTYGSV